MFKRAAGISEEVGEELVKKLEEFGWNAGDSRNSISIYSTLEEGEESNRLSVEIPIETILEVEYDTVGGFGEDVGGVTSICLTLGTRSELTFRKDGSVAVKI
ncbi:MAG: hypothetical protein KAR39_07125 [Thermoplasmata archaeon]|nr:hypothetical protein [Thermoplasmata archaeon]